MAGTNVIEIQAKKIALSGGLIRVACLQDEWYEDMQDPEILIRDLRKAQPRIDLFTFWQRLPETKPRYNYFMEWESIAALPIKGFKYWWEKQIDAKTRNLIRKAGKKGVKIEIVKFDDEFIKGMSSIFNETPIRQGRPFWHYGKDIESIRQEFSRNIFREIIIGAYHNGDLIGFVMLASAGNYAMTTQIISKIQHRDKSPNNALISKAVEICDAQNIPYLIYARWNDGTLGDFKRSNGFEKVDLPRYYIPLTLKGRMALRLKVHRGIARLVPNWLKVKLKNVRWKVYSWIYSKEENKTGSQ
jgi:hypothetical protein